VLQLVRVQFLSGSCVSPAFFVFRQGAMTKPSIYPTADRCVFGLRFGLELPIRFQGPVTVWTCGSQRLDDGCNLQSEHRPEYKFSSLSCPILCFEHSFFNNCIPLVVPENATTTISYIYRASYKYVIYPEN